MKNTILVLTSILMFAAGILTMFSSSDEYAAEKLLYRAKKINRKIAVNPDVVPPKMLASVEKDLTRILARYPQAASAKVAHLLLAEFYLRNEKHEQALSTLDEIIKAYTQDRDLISTAYSLKAFAYEDQGQWDKALKELAIVKNQYADTPQGLSVPLYIGNYYIKEGKQAQAEQAFREAVSFYQKIERENRGEARGYGAANLLFRAYASLKQYEQAGEVIEEMINNYPKPLPLLQQLPKIELIFIKFLNKPDKALQLYENIKVRTKNKDFLRVLDEKIKALNVQETEQ